MSANIAQTCEGKYGLGTNRSRHWAVDPTCPSRGVDNGKVRPQFTGMPRQLLSRHFAGEIDVGERHVYGGTAGQKLQRLSCVGDRMHLEAVVDQRVFDHHADERFVLNQKHS